MTNHPIEEQDSLEARLRRTEKRKSYLAVNATAPIIEGEYDALINPDGPEAADTLCQMRAALVEAHGLIRVGGVTYGQMMNARQMIDAALTATKEKE